jgi:hypothetical protein
VAHYARGKVILTVAHLCACDPICLNPAHVIAACQRCHLRIDRFKHAAHRLANQETRQEAQERRQRIIGERVKLLFGKSR